MMTTEKINARKGVKLIVEKSQPNGQVEISISIRSKKKCFFHWGLCQKGKSQWKIPPKSLWPEGSNVFKNTALQTPFLSRNGQDKVLIRLDQSLNFSFIYFALFFPEENRWDNNKGKNYRIKLQNSVNPSASPTAVLKNEIKGKEILFEGFDDFDEEGQLASAVVKDDNQYHVILLSDIQGALILHWGIAVKSPYEWSLPPESLRPEGTTVFENKAARTPFVFQDGLNLLKLQWKEQEAPLGISFVLNQPDTGRWLKKGGANFYSPMGFPAHRDITFETPSLSYLADEIIRSEMQRNSWTLMHRFNLCHDLLTRIRDDKEGLALVFVWLRFSAIRQLTWQRRYNTKPRELSHAQDRLTLKLADIYKTSKPASRRLIRLVFSTLGRGGEGAMGQRIRDEILHIMHRHKIKEVTGHFMEEWHQKLHNNTTPDDIVICEAYLAFLRSDGDLKLFYKTCEASGVTKERLEAFERPIVTDPDFAPHLKEGLINDFENYLKILKSVHSATDLESAVERLEQPVDNKDLDFILKHKDDPKLSVIDLADKITAAREGLNNFLKKQVNSRSIRGLLYLDLALEDFLRVVVERSINDKTDEELLIALISLVLKDLRISGDNEELAACFRQWKALDKMSHSNRNWALHAKSVLDRISREIGDFIDYYYLLLQKKAEQLGQAFQADLWTINLFTEEFVRGRPLFVMSILIRHLESILRKSANLGDWQVISPGVGWGQVEVVDTLRSIQDKIFDKPTVIFAEKVMGDEEPPKGVTGIVTPSAVDILSHVAVRARNYHLFYATCYDKGIIDALKNLRGQSVKLTMNASGDVSIDESSEEVHTQMSRKEGIAVKVIHVDFKQYAVTSMDFNETLVGGKSYNLRRIKDDLPRWIHVPASAALPFGVFEKVLAIRGNQDAARKYQELITHLDKNPKKLLNELRETIQRLQQPEELFPVLEKAMEKEGLPILQKQEDAWMCIKRVWASKWNERAYLSRKANDIPHEKIFIAVLIQEVVEAEYAFVIHTANPFTNNHDEIYAEIVLGLGETLVGNYPGRALSFTCEKDHLEPKILSYPSKSIGLYGGGLIFRSDSNGEDLEKYAGAGLYDSIMLEPRHGKVFLDYTQEPLLNDEDFRKKLLMNIARIGIAVEKPCQGIPQDIEGAYSKGKYYVVQTRTQMECKAGD